MDINGVNSMLITSPEMKEFSYFIDSELNPSLSSIEIHLSNEKTKVVFPMNKNFFSLYFG